MSIYVDVITGFLESGKTTFIRNLMEREDFEAYENVLLILCEEGMEEFDEDILADKKVNTVILEELSELTEEKFQEFVSQFNPEYILIEYNGTWDITKLLELKLPMRAKIRNIIFVSEALKFKQYLSNMVTLMQPHILNSNFVLFNRYEKLDESKRKKLRQGIKNINSNTEVFFSDAPTYNERIWSHFTPFKPLVKMTMSMRLIFLFLIVLSFIPVSAFQKSYPYMQSISTVFLGILIQAVPFILLGAFISSIIQVFFSTGWILKKLSRNNFLSFIIAVIAGFFVPVCDCGMVPIVSGLLKKETSLPQVITFWLASSAVNPVVLISVYYAFPEQRGLVLIRVAAGILIGVIVGVVLKFAKIETKDVIKENSKFQYIGSNLLDLSGSEKFKKAAVFLGAKFEFFRVAKYVIIGAFISSVLQIIMPQTIKSFVGGNMTVQFLIMALAAVLMSTCSTSNAFIGRSFYNNFSIMPIMSFIVMGPMLDFKNMVMLSEILKKQFLVKLSGLIIATGLVVFSILALCF